MFGFGRKNKKNADFSYIGKMSALICGNDVGVMDSIGEMLRCPREYFARYSDRYAERGMDTDKADEKELYLIGMTDELIEGGYVAEVDWKCGPEDFLWNLRQLKTYPLIAGYIDKLTLSEDGQVETWCKEISSAAEGIALLCVIDIDSDSYPLFIFKTDKDRGSIKTLEALANTYGHILVSDKLFPGDGK